MSGTRDCHACGGDGWLPSRPTGESACPYCNGSGQVSAFPIKLRVNPDPLGELVQSECGRWEDHGTPDHGVFDPARCECDDKPHPFVYLIANRYTTRLEIRDAAEAEEVYWAVCSGTFQLSHFKVARRIADALRPYVKAATVRRWPAPTGR